MGIRHSLEMSLSREEFFRALPAAVGPFVVDGDTIRPPGGTGGWLIRLTPLADHRVGSVAVARHRVEVDFQGASDSEVEVFMNRFRRGFLRGGG
ncbi:MAG: hypothetical protein H6Q10_3142 [Acidobacteria bacterium]|jgi:hypothetical protein|nr:hypothetical protein [Acidobacteriota bacterium]